MYYGFASDFLALIRITNATLVGAIVFSITVVLLIKKEIKNLFENATAYIAGIVLAFIPPCIFYFQKGSLYEMFSQVFLFGLNYSTEVSFWDKLINLRASLWPCCLLGLFPIIALLFSANRKVHYWILALSSFVFFMFAVTLGNSYLHYFTLVIPNMILGYYFILEQVCLKEKRFNWKVALSVLSFLCIFATLHDFVYWRTFYAGRTYIYECFYGNPENELPSVIDIKDKIPVEEQDSVYAYNLDSCSRWYVQAGLFPSNRYCDWQIHYISLDSKIKTELSDWLLYDSPKWIVLPTGEEITPNLINEIVSEKYIEYYSNDLYTLLKCE